MWRYKVLGSYSVGDVVECIARFSPPSGTPDLNFIGTITHIHDIDPKGIDGKYVIFDSWSDTAWRVFLADILGHRHLKV